MISSEKAREILGKQAKIMTDIQISDLLALYNHLANQYLDEIEKKIFGGKTIQELTC
mgnify:CR=1 FL=1